VVQAGLGGAARWLLFNAAYSEKLGMPVLNLRDYFDLQDGDVIEIRMSTDGVHSR